MAHDVFISHAQQDASIAAAIGKRLEAAGIRCWMTPEGIPSDNDWTNAARKAIESSSVILLVFSENADASPRIEREVAHAYYTRRVIIPLRLTNTPPRRDLLFYLGNVCWFDVQDPPAEEQLEALIAHIKGLILVRTAVPHQDAGRTTPTSNFLNSEVSASRASKYRTIRILNLAAIATSLLAVGGLLWIVLREPKERTSLAESRAQSIYPGSTASPKPSPQGAEEASSPAPANKFTPLGLWQLAIVGPTPFAQEEPRVAPLIPPAEDSAIASPSLPPADLTQGGRTGQTSTEESKGRLFPPTGMYQAPQHHHQAYHGLSSLEAQKKAALVAHERDALQNQLKEIQAKLQMTQRSADTLAIQRDELERQLEESDARAEAAQKNADIAASERDALRNQLNEAENRAITAEKSEGLATGQVNELQGKLEESEAKARAAQNDGDVARSQRDGLQSQLLEAEAEAQTAQKNADLAARQRSALEDQLRNAQEKNAQLVQHNNTDLDQSHSSVSKTQSRKAQEDVQSVSAVAHLTANQSESAQTHPPNPDQHAKPAPLTQELDSSVPPGLP